MRWFFFVALLGCRPWATSSPAPTDVVRDASALDASAQERAGDAEDAASDASIDASEPEAVRDAGPFEVRFLGDRNVYYAIPARSGPHRLIAMLHGVCNPPGYACGYWWRAAIERGVLVCPEGNAKCAWSCSDCRPDRKDGPPSWEESFVEIDRDLEKAIAKVESLHPGEIDREGAVLVGFSRGSYASVFIARQHPGRWPYLVLNEADTGVTAAQLRAAKVRAVVLMAGAIGLSAGPEKKTYDELVKAGFPAKYISMPKAAHHYSENIEDLMREALDFFAEQEATSARP
jgi:hypothetical protein